MLCRRYQYPELRADPFFQSLSPLDGRADELAPRASCALVTTRRKQRVPVFIFSAPGGGGSGTGGGTGGGAGASGHGGRALLDGSAVHATVTHCRGEWRRRLPDGPDA